MSAPDRHVWTRLVASGSPTVVPKGRVIFEQGQAPDAAYFVTTGRVRLTLLDEDQRPVWSKMLGPGSLLGLPAAISGQPYSMRATLLEDGQLVAISPDVLTETMRQEPGLARYVLELLSLEVADARRKAALLYGLPPKRQPSGNWTA